MPYLLEDLVVTRVDLVEEGANSAAFIELYKRKERCNNMELKDIIAKMTTEHAVVVQAEIDKLSNDVVKTKEAAEATLLKATEDLKAVNDELSKATSELSVLKADTTAFDEEGILKSMPDAARELFFKMKSQKEAAEETVRKAKEAEIHATAVAKATEFKAIPVEPEKLVGILKGCSPELLEVLTIVNTAMHETVLGEVGKAKPSNAAGTAEAAWAKIETKAQEIAKTRGVSKAKAITQAVDENPELYKEYLEGGAN